MTTFTSGSPRLPVPTRTTNTLAERTRRRPRARGRLKSQTHEVDKTKYRHYHKNYGHTIKEFIMLRDKIEELIQTDNLQKFVKKGADFGYLDRTPRLKGVINTIARGFVKGSSSLTRKRCLPSLSTVAPITFSDQDFVRSNLKQNNLMVIIIEVTNFAVKKVLIDQGSSADILYMSTFQRLQIPETEICLYHEQLVGFSREHVDTCGYINLLMTFDDSNIETESLTKITTQKVQRFIWQNIICRYHIPNSMVTDNGTQFISKSLNFTKSYRSHISHQQSHPRRVSMIAQKSQGIMGQTITQHPMSLPLLPTILNWRDPYRLTFGTDDMILVEIGEPSLRKSSFNPAKNLSSLQTDLDLVKEDREQACIRQEACRHRAAHRYNSNIRPRDLDKSNLEMRGREKEKGSLQLSGKDLLESGNHSAMTHTVWNS
ncbi:hypothetical protein CR513_01860, partial [Mucuna pruriens]